MAEHEFSAAYIDAILRTFKGAPNGKRFELRVPMAALPVLKNPYEESWYPAKAVDGLFGAALATLGENILEEAAYRAIKDRYGPMVMPLFKKAVASKSPGPVLTAMEEMTSYALRGVVQRFKSTGEKSGVFATAYPVPVVPQTALSWRGVLRFVFEVTAPGKVTNTRHEDGGKVLYFELEWT